MVQALHRQVRPILAMCFEYQPNERKRKRKVMSQTRTARVRKVRDVQQNNSGFPLIEAATLLFGILKAASAVHGSLRSGQSNLTGPALRSKPVRPLQTAVNGVSADRNHHQMAITALRDVQITPTPPLPIEDEFRSIALAAPLVTPASQPRITELGHAILGLNPTSPARARAIEELHSIVRADYQNVIAAATFTAVTESLTEINFTPQVVKPDAGYILARQGSEGPQIRADIIRADDGGVVIALDADCFQGISCDDALGKLEARLREKGVDLEPVFCRAKRRNQFAAVRTAIRRG